jgi:serine/threonine protein kinase/Tol biopolymer transport system component
MPQEPQSLIDELAAAVADGRVLDWDVLESSAPSDAERASIRRLRAIAAIGQAHTELTVSDTVSESLSVRSLLPCAEDPSAPAHWGPLRILERVGRGRFGDVYRAWDRNLDREVALKLLRRRDDATAADREVIEEGRLMARVRHPNVVTIHGAQRIDGRIGLWMEFVEGRTLEAELKEHGPFSADEVVRVGIELCRALGAVHESGLVHRDVKAQNVLRDRRGRILLGDFGTGRELDDEAPVADDIAGTPAYLAPEIFTQSPATRQSDLYSLGVLLFHLATGTYPVPGRRIAQIREAHHHRSRVSIDTLRSDLPRALVDVIERAMEHDPSRRFESATAMETALATCAARSTSSWTRDSRRRPLAATVLVLTIASGMGLVTWVKSRPSSESIPLRRSPLTSAPSSPPLPVPQMGIEFEKEPESDSPLPPESSVRTRPAGIAFVHIDEGLERMVNFRTLAPDGVHATCAGGRMALGVCNLVTGKVETIREGTGLEGSPASLLSADGTRVAYLWTTDRSQSHTLRLINRDGTGDRELGRDSADARFLAIDKWTADSRALLVRSRTARGTFQFAIVPVDGGRSDLLFDVDVGDASLDLSPDGRHLVTTRSAAGTAARDLAVIDADGGERWLLHTPSDEWAATWTTDGGAIVFLSDSLGGTALFSVRVENGQATAPPELVQDFGRSSIWLRGYGRNGALLVQQITHWIDAFRASVDLDLGTITGLARLDPRASIGDTASPDWSPDGQRTALIAGAVGSPSLAKARVLVRDPQGRLERELPLPGRMTRASRLRWSPDGRWIAVYYRPDSEGPAVLDILDVGGDNHRRFISGPLGAPPGGLAQFAWSPDSAAIYYLEGGELRRREIDSGTTTAVTKAAGPFDVSHNGAIALLVPTPGVGCVLRVLRGQNVEERHRFPGGGDCEAVAWSRDGSKLVVSILTSRDAPTNLWALNAASGEPVRIAVPTEMITSLSLGVEGSPVLFSAGNPFPEYWLLSGIGQSLAAK